MPISHTMLQEGYSRMEQSDAAETPRHATSDIAAEIAPGVAAQVEKQITHGVWGDVTNRERHALEASHDDSPLVQAITVKLR